MNKTELELKLVEEGLVKSQAQANSIVSFILKEISDTLVEGGEVYFKGLGRFSVVIRKARKGVNPKTKESLDIPECNSVKFKISKNLKDRLN